MRRTTQCVLRIASTRRHGQQVCRALSLSATAFKGQQQSIQFGTAYAFTEELEPGQVYNYRFDTREIKGPIQEAVTSCGWTYQGVALGSFRRYHGQGG